MMQAPRSNGSVALERQFNANELSSLLNTLKSEYPSCKIEISGSCQNNRVYKRFLVIQQGNVAFCDSQPPTLDSFVDVIHKKIDSDWVNRIFELSQGNLNEEVTPKQFCERLVHARVIEKSVLLKKLLLAYILAIEPLFTCSGRLTLTPLPNEQRFAAMDWSVFRQSLEKREDKWDNYSALSDGMHSVAVLTESGIEAVQAQFLNDAGEEKLAHLVQNLVDGHNSIVDQAQRFNADPLALARCVIKGIEKGWLTIDQETEAINYGQRKNVLVIDKDPTTRKMMLKILQEFYNPISSAEILGALSIISKQNVDLVIVASSISSGNGLQLCKIVRQNPIYQNLPIVFVSSKEGFLDRLKAKIAGVTDYITHPFDSSQVVYTLECNLN